MKRGLRQGQARVLWLGKTLTRRVVQGVERSALLGSIKCCLALAGSGSPLRHVTMAGAHHAGGEPSHEASMLHMTLLLLALRTTPADAFTRTGHGLPLWTTGDRCHDEYLEVRVGLICDSLNLLETKLCCCHGLWNVTWPVTYRPVGGRRDRQASQADGWSRCGLGGELPQPHNAGDWTCDPVLHCGRVCCMGCLGDETPLT